MAGEAVKGRSFFGYVVQFPRKKWQCGVAPTRVLVPGYNDIIQLHDHSSIILLFLSFSFFHTHSLFL